MTRDGDQGQQLAEHPEVDQPGVVDRIRFGVAITGAVLLVIFLVQNLQDAEIKFLWLSADMPLIIALVASALLGALAWGIVGFFRQRTRDAEIHAKVRAERAKK